MPNGSSTSQKFYKLQCVECKAEYDEKQTSTSCLKCDGALDVIYDYERIKRRMNMFALKNSPISAMKYLDFYPILDLEKIVSLKEGGTPLYHAKHLGKKLGLQKLYVKNEGANPTGVFKDRGTLVEVTKALELGAKAICLASSGNMAASVAAYSTVAGIPCYVMVPEKTPIGKLSQTISYGARVLLIRGAYSECAKLAVQIAKENDFYLAGDYVFRREGQKSQAYEICEQLFWRAPDYVICPIGCGTNLSAIWKGFKEFHKLGFIDKLPKLIGVQPSGCQTVVEAFKEKKRKVATADHIDTVCSAVAVNYPLDGNMVLKAIKDSGGMAVAVDDDDTLDAEALLANIESIFVEPSGALPVGALNQLSKKGIFKKDDTVVVMATGNGLKDPVTAMSNLPSPPSLEPSKEDINRYLKYKLYKLRAASSKGRQKTLWKKMPTEKQLQKIIKEKFDILIKGDYLRAVHGELLNFQAKGKSVTESDLQKIVENVLKEFSSKKPVLKIIDFDLQISKAKRPVTTIDIEFMGKKICAKAEGVGPVDAIIEALKKGIAKDDKLEVKLLDYAVTIHSAGTDAAVEVNITMGDKSGEKVLGSATSPDIIQASIDAYIRGYNALYWKSKKK
ncbi:threonine synthase [Patescibacteria group bacterium]